MEVTWETWLCLRFVILTPRICFCLQGRHWYSPTMLQYVIAQKITSSFFHLVLSSLYDSFSFSSCPSRCFCYFLSTSVPSIPLLRSFSSSLDSFVLVFSLFVFLSSISHSISAYMFACTFLMFFFLLFHLSVFFCSTSSFFVRIVTHIILRPGSQRRGPSLFSRRKSLYRDRAINSSSCSAGIFHNVKLLSMDGLRSGTGSKAAFSAPRVTLCSRVSHDFTFL